MFHPWVQSRVNNLVLQNIINLHASTKSKLITDLSFSPRFSHELSIFKIRVLKFEKKFLKNPSTEIKLAIPLAGKIKNLLNLVKNLYIIIKR